MKELRGLTYEQNKKFRFAIDSGYFDDWEQDPRKWKHTFAGAFLWKYPHRVKILNILKDIVGNVPTWDDLNDEVLRDLVDELTGQNLATSSIRTMCAELKALLNSNKRKLPFNEFGDILSVKGTATQSVYLTSREMEMFMAYKPTTDTEHFVHRNFCVSMMTGARLIDTLKLTISNCDIETNMLSYVPQKTPGLVVYVPVDERHNLRFYLADVCKDERCLDTYNEVLRRICKVIGIDTVCTVVKAGKSRTAPKYELVSSHTARRTFATNLYLAGVSLEDIAMMMGHGKNIDTTKRYICAERTLNPSVMSYFQKPDKPATPQAASYTDEELDAYEDALLDE
jgi:site-specific recombinase XerD